MPSVVRPNFHHTMAESIYEKIQNRSANYFYYLGKTLPYNLLESGLIDAPTPDNNFVDENDARNNIIGVKKMSISDVSFCARRINWVSGTVYDMYDTTHVNTDDRDFYVLTDDFNVYKCIFNNYGAASTAKPSGTDTDYFETADGYIWKFMYFIPITLRNKFLTSGYMPVTKKVKNQYYSNGEIAGYVINDGGQDYDAEQTYAVVGGDGVDADIDLVIENGIITGLVINDAGSGYTTATLNVVKGPLDPGEGADITLQLSSPGNLDSLQADVETLTTAGDISSILITASNPGYSSAPAVTIEGDGTGATATATLDINGEVSGVTITNRGSGYTYAIVTIASEGAVTTTARAIVSPINGHGFNAPRELIADILCFYTSFENETNHGMIVNNDYRQFGIIKDLENFDAVRYYDTASGSALYKLSATLVPSEWAEDSILKDSAGVNTGIHVVSVDTDGMIVSSTSSDTIDTNTEFKNQAESSSFTPTAVTNPDINKFSGEMLFIDNRLAFTSTEEQSVVFRSFIRF